MMNQSFMNSDWNLERFEEIWKPNLSFNIFIILEDISLGLKILDILTGWCPNQDGDLSKSDIWKNFPEDPELFYSGICRAFNEKDSFLGKNLKGASNWMKIEGRSVELRKGIKVREQDREKERTRELNWSIFLHIWICHKDSHYCA